MNGTGVFSYLEQAEIEKEEPRTNTNGHGLSYIVCVYSRESVVLFFVCLILIILGCGGRIDTRPPEAVSQPVSSPSEENPFSLHIPFSPEPPLFSLESSLRWDDRTPPIVFLKSRFQGNVQVSVYRSDTPVEILSCFDSISEVPQIEEIFAGLGRAEGQESGHFSEKAGNDTAIGKFSKIHAFSFHLARHEEREWVRREVQLPLLAPGLYLVEAHTGPQAAYLPLLVSSDTLLSLPTRRGALIWFQSRAGESHGNFPLFYGRPGEPWEKAQTTEEGLAELHFHGPDLCWIMPWKGNRLHCRPGQRDQTKIGEVVYDPLRTHRIVLPEGKWVFEAGSAISITGWSCLEEAWAEMRLAHRKASGSWETVDQQRRLLQNSKADFFFTPGPPGPYRIEFGDDKVEIYVSGKEDIPFFLPMKREWRWNDSSVDAWVPAGEFARLLVLQSDHEVVSYEKVPPFAEGKIVRLPIARSGNLTLESFRSDGAYLLRESFEMGPALRSSSPLFFSSCAPTPLSIPNGFSGPGTLTILASPFERKEIERNGVPEQTVRARGKSMEALHRRWAQKELIACYAKASIAYQSKEYREAIQNCMKVLQFLPDHPEASRILFLAWKAMDPHFGKEGFEVDLLARLEKTVLEESFSGLALEDFLQKIAENAGVCIETDPTALSRIPSPLKKIDRVPLGESALSLLNYVLARCNLIYKIEHGVVFVTSSQEGSAANVEEMDRRLEAELKKDFSAPREPKNGQEPPFPRVLYTGPALLETSVKFPTPGVWKLTFCHSGPDGKIRQWDLAIVKNAMESE